MLFSSVLLKNSVEKYQQSRQERYSTGESINDGISSAVTSSMLVIAIIFVALEFLLLFFAINIALNCTQGGAERIVHVVLAILFTVPYMLLSIFFSDCAKKTLKGN
jgi:NADH:ubiquinone oxidoreductase subunit 3 (subunit A)